MFKHEREYGNHWEKGLLLTISHGVANYSPTVVLGLLVGVGLGGAVYEASKVAEAINPGAVEAIRNNPQGLDFFNTIYYHRTVQIIDHPEQVLTSFAAAGAIMGGLVKRVL